MQVRADIKVIKTIFTKVSLAAAAQTKGAAPCKRFMTEIQIHQEERKREERREDKGKKKRVADGINRERMKKARNEKHWKE